MGDVDQLRHARETLLHLAHVDGQTNTQPTAGDVGDDDELADGRASSRLSSVESAAAKARLRRLRRSEMGRLLRRHDGPPRLAPGGYFPLLLIGYFEGIDSKRGIACTGC